MVFPAANRGVRQREGFSAGQMGRGAGRTVLRANVWQRVGGRGRRDDEEHHIPDLGEEGIPEEAEGTLESKKSSSSNANWDRAAGQEHKGESMEGRSKWEHREEMRESKQDVAKSGKQAADPKDERVQQKSSEVNESQIHSSRVGCSFCGLKNHVF